MFDVSNILRKWKTSIKRNLTQHKTLWWKMMTLKSWQNF